MDNEKTLLTKDLENLETNKDAAGLEKFAEDAEIIGGHEELVERAKKFAAELKAKANQVGVPTPGEEKEITDLGGSTTEVAAQVEEKKAEATETAVVTEQAIDAKVADTAQENVTEKGNKEVVGENFPISLDYVGQHFGTDEGNTEDSPFNKGPLDYEITGKVMLNSGPSAGGKEYLSVPVTYNIYRGINGDKTPIFQKTGEEGYDFEKPQVVSRNVFFEPGTKEVYYVDDSLGKKSIPSAAMVAMMEKAYSELKNGSGSSVEVGKEESVENQAKKDSIETGDLEEMTKKYGEIQEKILSGPLQILKTMTEEEVNAFGKADPSNLKYLKSTLNLLDDPAAVHNGALVYDNLKKYTNFLQKVRNEDYSNIIMSSAEMQSLSARQDKLRNAMFDKRSK